MGGKPWWLRLDGVPPGWKEEPSQRPRRSASDPASRWTDLTRLVKNQSGAVFRAHARGRGVLDLSPGPLFGPPWLISWIVHWMMYPNQYKVEIQWYHKPPPDSLVEKGTSGRWMTRSEAVEVLEEIAEELSVTN